MALEFLDLFVVIIQNFYISYTVWYCTEEKSKKKLWGLTILGIMVSNNFITGTFLNPLYIGIIGFHILNLFFTGFLYKSILKKAIIAHSIAYMNMSIYFIITKNFIYTLTSSMTVYNEMNSIFAIIDYFIGAAIILYFIYNIDFSKRIYKAFIHENLVSTLCIATFLLDYVIILSTVVIDNNYNVVNIFIQLLLVILVIGMLVYFNKINNKTKNILVINKALENKNNELRKIKHDYGAQISYLYGICLLERYDDLKKELKKIINNNENTASAVEVKMNCNNSESILSIVLNTAIEQGINVIIDEKYDLSLLKIEQVYLFRILSNIVSNAIRAMDGKGTIEAESYENFKNVIIKIRNNGPMIQKDLIKTIFEPGFTTKEDNEEDHGFGLSIVKELIEKNNGNISVTSCVEFTEFKIVFPIK